MADSVETARLKAQYKLQGSQQQSLADAWTKLAVGEQTTQKSLGDLRAKRATDFTKNAAAYVKARDTGTTAAKVRAAVELAKLRALAPVEFAKAATLPDRRLQDKVTEGLSFAGMAETPDKDTNKATKAWQMFLTTVQPSSANVLGSYEWMVDTYGDPGYLGINNGPLRDKLAEVMQKVGVEKKNAADFDASLEKVGASWETWLRNHPEYQGREDQDGTFEAFQRDAPIDESILPGASSVFMQNIEDVARNPQAHPTFFGDIDAGIAESNKEQKRYEDKLEALGLLDIEETPGESTDPTMREILAGWVRRPEVQWWAQKNGFKLGTAEPVDPESPLGKDVAAGRYPDKLLVNGMLYTSSPDDIRALRFAAAQTEGDPGNNILRALGVARKTGPRTMVEVEEIVSAGQPLTLTKKGRYQNGVVALDSEGNFRWTTDGETWTPIEKTAGQNMMVEAEAAGAVDMVETDLPGEVGKPQTRTRLLEYREPIYGEDYPGSVRGVDAETGEEVYLKPEQVAKEPFFPAGEPSKGPSIAERINKASAAKTMKKEGHDLSDEGQNQDVPGEKPTGAQKKQARTATEAMRAAVKVLPAGRKGDRGAPDPGQIPGMERALTTGPKTPEPPAAPEEPKAPAPRRTYEESIREAAKGKLPGTPSQVVGEGTGPQGPPAPPQARVNAGGVGGMEVESGTTTTAKTTPTATTAPDAQKKALLESRKRRQAAEAAAQAERAGSTGTGAQP